MFSRLLLACLIALAFCLPAPAQGKDTTTVYFVTNRAKALENKHCSKNFDQFQSTFGSNIVYGVTEVKLPEKQYEWQHTCKRLKYLSNLRKEERLSFKSVVTGTCFSNVEPLKNVVATNKKVLLFVHGYNMDVTMSVQILARIVNDLKQLYPEDAADLVPIAFCWPSENRWHRYISDQERVQLSQPSFNKFMEEIGFGIRPDQTNTKTLSMISHSLGNTLTVNYLISRGQQISVPDHQIERVLLCSPDISYYLYFMNQDTILKNCDSVSVLFSGNDRPILVSRLLHNCPRLGSPFSQPSKVLARVLPKQMNPIFHFQVKPVPDWMKGIPAIAATCNDTDGSDKTTLDVPPTHFVDFTDLDVGMTRLALPFLTFQIGHSLPGPLLSSLLVSKDLRPPHSWNYIVDPKKLEKSGYFDEQIDRVMQTYKLQFIHQSK